MTNNVGFTSSVGDTTWAVLQLVLSETNKIGDIKTKFSVVTNEWLNLKNSSLKFKTP